MKFAYPLCLWLIPLILAAGAGLWLLAQRLARRRLAQFGPPDRLSRILHTVNPRARACKFGLAVTSLGLLALAAARPMIGPRSQHGEQSGAEFFIILDVSKSMLVPDVPPSRLEAVKTTLEEWLKSRHGDRIGLILMAGDAFIQAPLTNDYTALREVLAQSGPRSMSRGGTNIAGAIQMAVTAFKKSDVKKRALVIVSDGENQEGNAVEAARAAHSADGVTIFTVGVGTDEGGNVPEVHRGKSGASAGFVKDEYGVTARSRLDERSLRTIATAGGGRYFRFHPDDDVWKALYTQSLQPLARAMDKLDLQDYDDLFQIPLILALILLAAEIAISNRLKNPLRPKSAVVLPPPASDPTAVTMNTSVRPLRATALLWLLAIVSSHASPAALSAEEAEKLVKEGKAGEAAAALRATAQQNPDDPFPLYNYGIASYVSGNYQDAISAFSEVALCRDEKLRALALTNLGNAQYRLGKTLLESRNGPGAIVSWERAVEYYESSVKERNDRTAAHNLEVAKANLEGVLLAEGKRALDKARQTTDPGQRTGPAGTALDYLEKAIALDSSNKPAVVQRDEARRLLSEALRDQARELRDRAAKSEPGKDKGTEKEKLNLQASQAYEKAVEVAPENAEVAREMSDFKKAVSKDFADAAESRLEEAMKNDEAKGPREARLLNKERNLTQALTGAEKALVFDEANARAKELKNKALTELEKSHVERGDALQAKADEAAAQEKRPDGATRQYRNAMEEYQKALEINPDNAHAKEALATVQSKLATQLTKNGESEMQKAEDAVGKPESGDTASAPADPKKLQEGIGHLEKAAQTLGQAEALDPGKNNAAGLQKKAEAQLGQLRNKLDGALVKNEEGKPKGGEPGESSGGPGEGDGAPGDEAGELKDGNQQVGARVGGGKPPLNFSEIRGGSEQEGQFVDKTRKESIRDW